MIESIDDEYIIKYFFSDSSRISSRINSNRIRSLDSNPVIKNYLENRYSDSKSVVETINRIYYGIDVRPVCLVCGKEVKYLSKDVYSKHCSRKCSANDIETREKSKQTCLERYGVENGGCSREALEKIKQTNLDRRCVSYSFLDSVVKEKSRETCRRRYGCDWYVQSKIAKKLYRDNCKKKYGVEFVWQRRDVINKIKRVKYKRYGNEGYVNVEKSKETSRDRYGCDSWTQSEVGRKRLSNQYYDALEKREKTCLERYGVRYRMEDPNYRRLLSEKMVSQNRIGSHISKEESRLYKMISEYFPDVVSQYISDRYPYVCDFYIPSLDLYIEYNGTWTHGSHPFNETDECDLLILEKWKNKCSKYYDNAIYVWTEHDVKKRNIAKERGINFIEWFSYSEAIEGVRKIVELKNL